MLVCIGGVNINITGRGLHSLSTTALEQIDLRGKHESPVIEPEPLLSEYVVITFLDSVIGGGGGLKHLNLPKKFRVQPTAEMRLFVLFQL